MRSGGFISQGFPRSLHFPHVSGISSRFARGGRAEQGTWLAWMRQAGGGGGRPGEEFPRLEHPSRASRPALGFQVGSRQWMEIRSPRSLSSRTPRRAEGTGWNWRRDPGRRRERRAPPPPHHPPRPRLESGADAGRDPRFARLGLGRG